MKGVIFINKTNIEDVLKFALSEGIINLDDVQKNMKEREKQRLLNKHKYKIFQDKDGRWKTTVLIQESEDSEKKRRKLVAKSSYSDLEKYLINFYATEEDLEYEKEKLITIRNLLTEWLAYKNSHTISSSYIRRIKNDWNKYYEKSYIVDIPVADLTYLTLDKWAHDLIKDNNLTKKQYYNMSIIIRQILDYSVELEYIQNNPFSRVVIDSKMFKHNPKPKSETQVFNLKDEIEICNAAMDRYNLRPKSITPLAIIFNFNVGLRVGELVALRWSDIDEHNYIHVQRMEVVDYLLDNSGEVKRNGVKIAEHTKSYAGDRIIYLNEKSREILSLVKKRNLQYGYYDEDYIFVNSQSSRLTSSSVNNFLYKLCDDINTSHKSSHKIRKTYISSLFDSGLNIDKIREIAGHEDERTSLNNYCFERKDNSDTEKILESISQKII